MGKTSSRVPTEVSDNLPQNGRVRIPVREFLDCLNENERIELINKLKPPHTHSKKSKGKILS